VRRAGDELLAALGVAHVDLVLLDWAAAAGGAADALPASVAAAWTGVEALLDANAARAAGLAHAGWRGVEALLAACRVKPVVNAAELHPLLPQARTLRTQRRMRLPSRDATPQRKMCGIARRKGVELLALAPLARGAAALLQHPTVTELAKAHGVTPAQARAPRPAACAAADARSPAQVVLRYNVQRGVAAMPAAGTPADQLDGVFAFQLTYPQKVLMDTLDNGTRVLAPPPGCTFPADD
jgi:diketogulonate reductase-like aldo/keto reductase